MSRKSGRELSAANRAKLEEAIVHLRKGITCSEEVIAALQEILNGSDEEKIGRAWEIAEQRLLN